MKMVWAFLGAGALAALYSLVMYRRRFRSQRSWARRRLSSRMASVERNSPFGSSRDDAESAPSFIEQTCVFSMSLTERFWNETMQARAAEMAFIHEHGAFLSTVKIERGQRHVMVTIAEVLPESRSAEWHIRSFELFPGSSSLTRGGVILWELHTADPSDVSGTSGHRGLELRFEHDSLALSIRDYFPNSQSRMEEPRRKLIARIPLDIRLLSRFQVPDETADPLGPRAGGKTHVVFPADSPTISFFEHTDTEVGLVWHLCRQDFVPREHSARSRTLDADEVRHRA